MTSPNEVFKKIRRIQIQTTHLANDLLAGAYRSAFKGKGMEFEEVREYQPGDDIRTIDWNVTARMQHPYVKNFREERDITVMLVVDISSSSRFGSHKLKSELTAEIGAVIAFSAIKNNDRIGLILFSDVVEKYIPPRKGTRHVMRLIRELLLNEPSHRKTNIAVALDFLGSVVAKSGVCFLISDFISPSYAHEVALIAKKHDLITIGITDPYELAFPKVGLISLQDLETGETQIIDSSDETTQETFKKNAAERLRTHQRLMNKIGAGFIDLRTNQPYMPAIKKFFKIRGKQRR